MKKYLLLSLSIICILTFFVGSVNAWEFDNVKTYDVETKTATLTNAFGLGGDIARVKLDTPSLFQVMVGYQKVAQFTINPYTDYEKLLDSITFYNLKEDSKNIDLTYDIKYLGTEEIEVEDYKEVCGYSELSKNNTCVYEKSGTHTIIREVWKDWDKNAYSNKEVIIGIFTDVKPEQTIEWVPKIAGIEIPEWAIYTSGAVTTYDGIYTVQTYLNNGTFNITSSDLTNVTVLVVAGGGAGGGSGPTNAGGGGGAGGYLYNATYFVSTGDYIVTVGLGGFKNTTSVGTNGSYSMFGNSTYNLTARGGGRGGGIAAVDNKGSSGGSGGGGAADGGLKGSGTAGQGTEGSNATSSLGGCGGGSSTTCTFGNPVGGNGTANSINGTSVYYAGGGGGDNYNGAVIYIGGLGGGGRGGYATDKNGVSGTNGTGGGGGGGGNTGTGGNGGSGIVIIRYLPLTGDNSPDVTLNSPIANYNSKNQTIFFNCTGSDGQNLTTLEFLLNSTVNGTNSTPINNTAWIIPRTLQDGYYNWTCRGTDNASQITTASARFFTINTTPFIEFLTPPTLVNYANITQEYIPMKVNVSTLYFKNITYFLENFNGTNYTQFYTNETYDINFTDMPDGHYHYNVTICTTTNKCNYTETRHVNHDNTPPTIIIISGNGSIAYQNLSSNHTISYNISDQKLSSCWINYNGTNRTIPCTNNTINTTNFTLQFGIYNATIWANDTFGNNQSSFINWNYRLLFVSQSFLSPILEGTISPFSINLITNGTDITSGNLNYNGTNYAANIINHGSNNYTLTKTIDPFSVSANKNITFYWNITQDIWYYAINSSNQTIINVALDNCSVFTYTILNLTLLDEATQTPLVGTLEISIHLLDVLRTNTIVSLGDKLNGSSNYGVCLSTNLTGNYSLDAIIKYYADTYAIEYYNIENYFLTYANQTQNISLYDLNLSYSTEFKLIFTGTDFLPAEGVLVFLERQYLEEDQFKTVELPKTDSGGQTVLHLVRNDIVYNLKFMKDGILLKEYLNLRAFCNDYTIGDCEIRTNAISESSEVSNYNEEVGVVSNPPTYNKSSGVVSYSYTAFDGETKTVLLSVERRDIFGNISVCSNTLSSASGTLSCTVSSDITDTTLLAIVEVDGEVISMTPIAIDTSAYGSFGPVAWFLLALGLVLISSRDKNLILLSLLMSYIGAVSLGLIVGGIIGFGSAGIWIIIITLVGLWRLNRNKL